MSDATLTPEDQHLLVERDGHVMVLTMNRPERRNALSPSMMQRMSEAWDEINANPDIRVAILTGAGGCFCAGADLAGDDRSRTRATRSSEARRRRRGRRASPTSAGASSSRC